MSRPIDPFDALRLRLECAVRDEMKQKGDTQLAHATKPAKSRAWYRRRLGVAVVATALLSGTALAATAPWNPQIGGDNGQTPPQRASTLTPKDQRAHLAVLRAPQSEADRSPAVERALRLVGSNLGSGIRVDGVRLLRSDRNRAVLLVPFEHVGSQDAGFADGLCVFAANLSTLPVGETETDTANPSRSGPVAPTESSSASCGTSQDVRRGQLRSSQFGLVPDGVKRVQLEATDGTVANADVEKNLYVVPSGERPDDESEITWLDARGLEVRKNAF